MSSMKEGLSYYKLCLLKEYFEKGMSLTRYVKYLIAFFGLASGNVVITMMIGLTYATVSFFIGYFWIKWGIYTAELEVSNQFNLFVKEMRKRKV